MVKSYSLPRKVAVDASMSLYQFLIAVRQVVFKFEATVTKNAKVDIVEQTRPASSA